jgi:hypothetical protein
MSEAPNNHETLSPEERRSRVRALLEVPPEPDESSEKPSDSGAEDDDNSEEKPQRRSVADALVEVALHHHTVFHSEDRIAHVRHALTGEVRTVNGEAFQDWLRAEHFTTNAKAPSRLAVTQACDTISSIARERGERRDVFVRAAPHGDHGDRYYVDLGQPGNRRSVFVEPGRWSIVDAPPVDFVRPQSMLALPEPVPGGSATLLWQTVNIPVEAQPLVWVWMMDCFRADTPYPVLELLGEQGSAKSTTQSMLRDLIDPNACNLRAVPKTRTDIFVSAGVTHLTSYENVSHLSPEYQDALCTLSTGGGYAERKLYTNTEESVLRTKRPVVLNGIAAAVTAQDLVSRTISVELPTIEDRREVAEVRRLFDENRAAILGALFDDFAAALAMLPRVPIPPSAPRLLEYAKLGMAVELAAGRASNGFLRRFEKFAAEATARALDGSPVAAAIIAWFEVSSSRRREIAPSELLSELERYRPQGADAWPKTGKGLGDQLRRLAPALRGEGILITKLGKRGRLVVYEFSAIAKPDAETCDFHDVDLGLS